MTFVEWLRRYGHLILGAALIGMVIALGFEQPFVAAICCPIIGFILVILLWSPLSDAGDWFSCFPVLVSGLILLMSGGFGLTLALQTRAISSIALVFKSIALVLNGLILAPFAAPFVGPVAVALLKPLWQWFKNRSQE